MVNFFVNQFNSVFFFIREFVGDGVRRRRDGTEVIVVNPVSTVSIIRGLFSTAVSIQQPKLLHSVSLKHLPSSKLLK
jgi:hypothetical protein